MVNEEDELIEAMVACAIAKEDAVEKGQYSGREGDEATRRWAEADERMCNLVREFAPKVLQHRRGVRRAQKIMDIFEEERGHPLTTIEELEQWCGTPEGKAALQTFEVV